ncbi:MAG: CBS domain-containing protein [Candidatus Bathyarchaeia archaeon]
MDLSVNELRTTPIKVDPLTPVSKAISILKELNAYELFVEKLGKIGIVTVRDLLSVKDISKTKVSSIMNFVPKLQPTTSLNVAAKIMMDYRIKALPILENNKLIGQITILSILKAIEDKIPKTIKLSSIMTKNPITLKENDSIAKARRMMIDKKIDHLPITFNGKVLGVLTSSDIVFIMVKPEKLGKETIIPEIKSIMDFPAKEFMDKNPLMESLNESISSILKRMIKKKKTYCLINLWEELQGIITYRDYMKTLPKVSDSNELPIYIIGLPEDPFEAEVAKMKFIRIIKFFRKSFLKIIEAKSNIKTSPKNEKKGRKRYEVDVFIKTPKKTFTYSDFGWELSSIYDSILDKIKKIVSQKRSKRILKKKFEY